MGTRKSARKSSPPLKVWLTLDGAPWRPFEDSGTLLNPLRTPRTPGDIFSACEATLLAHLKAACLWPERQREDTWRIGDYSFYILEFSPARGVEMYVQFWSEPDEDGVVFEVASGTWNPPANEYVDPERQELLRDHGFELGSKAHNFEKVVAVRGARDVRALAREAVAILCRVLGYDGRQPLTFRLHLGTRLKPGVAFDSICASDLAKLMRRWGYTAEIEEHGGKRNLIRSTVDDQPFLIAFVGEEPEGSNEYGMIGLRAFFRFEVGVPEGLANSINQDYVAAKASVDEEGDLVVQTPILLHGGVTESNLESSFQIWRQTIEQIVRGLD